MILVLLINRLCNRISSLFPVIHETCQGRGSNRGREVSMNINELCVNCSSVNVSGCVGFRWFSPSLWYINTWGLRWISKYFSKLPFIHQNDLPYVILTWLAVYWNCCFRFQGVVVIKRVSVHRFRVSRWKRDSGLGTKTKLKTRSSRKKCWFCHIIAKYHIQAPPASPVMYGTGISQEVGNGGQVYRDM